jgi:hypothetical protein
MKHALSLWIVALVLLGCSKLETDSAKAKTMAAWKALQKVDHDVDNSNLAALKLDDPATFPPVIKYYRDVAFGYSQIDTEGVDEMLVNHLQDSMKVHTQMANALQSVLDDVIVLMKSREGGLDTSRAVGRFFADDEHQQSGAGFAELLYRLSTDDDFQNKLEEIRSKHRSEVLGAEDTFNKVADEDKSVAKSLTEKYGVQFIDTF